MKILFVIRSVGMGGATKQLAMTANALAEKGHKVSIYSYCWNKPYEGFSDKVKYIPSKDYGKFKEYFHAVSNIRHTVRKVNPDVVISWRANAGCFTRLATLGMKCKVVYSERTDPYMETSAFLKFATWICGFSDGGVFQTAKAMAYYPKLTDKATVIPNPFDCKVMPDIMPLENRRKEIACVGRFFMVQKRQDIMLDAFRLIHDELPDYRLVFYGDGDDFEKVKKMAKEKGLQDFVDFKGAVTDVINKIKSARVFALSSDYEGIPNVVLEAFAAGTPVVATDCSPGGVRVLIDDAINGFIIPIRDTKSLAQKTLQIIKDNDLSMQFIVHSRDKLSKFKYENISILWNEYLKKIHQKGDTI